MNGAQKTNRRRTARAIEKDASKLRRRRRCDNCNKLYQPRRDDQKFCRDNEDPDKCRKEFYRYGSSYGPLKTGLHKAIEKKYSELLRVMESGLKKQSERYRVRVSQLEIECKNLTFQMSAVREQIELLLVERSNAEAKPQAG